MAARRRTAEDWREIVRDWRASGRSKSDYARGLGVSPITLGWWPWKVGAATLEPTGTPSFAEVVVVSPYERKAPPDLVVEIGALRVRGPSGFDAGELRRLVSALC